MLAEEDRQNLPSFQINPDSISLSNVILFLERALKKNPAWVAGHLRYATLQSSLGRDAAAYASALAVKNLSKKNSNHWKKAYELEAVCLLSQKQYSRAKAILGDLLKESPADSVYENLSLIHI